MPIDDHFPYTSGGDHPYAYHYPSPVGACPICGQYQPVTSAWYSSGPEVTKEDLEELSKKIDKRLERLEDAIRLLVAPKGEVVFP